MAIRQKEQTNKFLEITDPKKAVGLWSYRVVRETAMTPVGNTAQALGRFLNGDIVRWQHRERMAEALTSKGVGLVGGKSPARAMGECLAEADADKNRLSVPEWREKYAWLLAWSRYSCRLIAPNVMAAEKDVQMFFGLASAGVSCHEGTLHGGRVFFLRKKVETGGELERRSLRDTQSFDRIGAARPLETPSGLGLSPSGNPTLSRGRIPTARVELSSSVAPTPQLDSVEGSSRPNDASGPFSDCGVGASEQNGKFQDAPSLATSENGLLSRSAQADCVQKSQYRYFVAVVLKPGGTKWWWSLERVNVTWTTNTYDRLIIDPRGKLEWSPMDAEVLTEQVVEKNVCLFMLEDDALFKAITDNELNPSEKYAHLCYAFDFFCRNPEGEVKAVGEGEQRNGQSVTSGEDTPRIAPPSELASLGGYASPLKTAPSTKHQAPSTTFYLRWSAFFNPKKLKFDATSRQAPRIIEVMGERKKGWVKRQIEVKEEGLGIGDSGLGELKTAKRGNKTLSVFSKKDAGKARLIDARLGLGDTPLDKYVQEVARWVVENNGCAVLPNGASRNLRLALSHALFFVTLPNRKPNEPGGILRGYQLPGRLVEHAQGDVRCDNLKAMKERVLKQSEESTDRRRKMIVDCLFTRACTAVLLRNNGSVLERRSLRDTQKEAFSDVATTARVEFSSSVAPTPQSKNALSASGENDGNWAKRSCGVARADKTTIPSAGVVAAQVSPNSAYAEGICVQKVTEKTIVPIMESIGARQIIEKAAWQRGFMEGNPLNQFKAGPTAGIGKLPDLSLALAFENRLGLKGETASATDLLVQTAPIRSLKDSQGPIREAIAGVYPCRSVWTPSPGKERGFVTYPSDAVRIVRDEGRYYLLAFPKYAKYRVDRDLAFEPDVPGKARRKVPAPQSPIPNPQSQSTKHQAPSTKHHSVPVCAYSFKSVGSVRSRADSYVVEEIFDFNKMMRLARDGRILLYSIDFGKDKWLADIVFSNENKQPCKIVPTIPILAPVGTDKKDALDDGRKSGTNIETKVALTSETAQAFITFTFNPTVARDGRKVEGRSWKSYCDAFPIEEKRHIVRWPDLNADRLRDTQKEAFSDVANDGAAMEVSSRSAAPTPQSKNALSASNTLGEALQKVIETDGILLTDKEHIDGAIRAATYVVKDDPYNGYILKDRIFKDTDGRAEWRKEKSEEYVSGLNDKQKKNRAALNAKYEAQRKEQKGKPLCEVLSPDIAKEAEIDFTRQIEADTLVDAKTPKDFKLEEPIRVGDDFKDAVAREFKRIAYTGTMGWRQKLNRPAHEVAVGIWLARL